MNLSVDIGSLRVMLPLPRRAGCSIMIIEMMDGWCGLSSFWRGRRSQAAALDGNLGLGRDKEKRVLMTLLLIKEY